MVPSFPKFETGPDPTGSPRKFTQGEAKGRGTVSLLDLAFGPWLLWDPVLRQKQPNISKRLGLLGDNAFFFNQLQDRQEQANERLISFVVAANGRFIAKYLGQGDAPD